MLNTPFGGAALEECKPSRGALGPLFTQAAITFGEQFVTVNVLDIRAGDVLLFAPSARRQIRKHPVYRYQRLLFGPDAAKWTHCALIDENLTVWDAMPNTNVRSRPLREVLRETHGLALLRPSKVLDPIRLRTSILQFSNHQYRVFTVETLGRLAARLKRAGHVNSKATADRYVLCSLFVADILRRASLHGYFRALPITLPADFAVDEEFAEVPLQWCFADP